VDEIKTFGGDEDSAPGAEVSTRQILMSVNLRTYTSRVDALGRKREHEPVLSDKWQPNGFKRLLADDAEPPNITLGGKHNFLAVRHPCRIGAVQRSLREALGFAGSDYIHVQRKPVQFTSPSSRNKVQGENKQSTGKSRDWWQGAGG
jgi:hypothetical protein